jgi:hypothetical protein
MLLLASNTKRTFVVLDVPFRCAKLEDVARQSIIIAIKRIAKIINNTYAEFCNRK